MTCRGMDLVANVPAESRDQGPKTAAELVVTVCKDFC